MASSNDSQMLPVGTVLIGRYRIERYLASGGFGNTYVARHIELDCEVAIKEFFMRGVNHRMDDTMTVAVSNDANADGFALQLNKFRREAKQLWKLKNDHIVHVTDLFDANGTAYYVMDLIYGESLDKRVARKPLSETETRQVVAQILDPLSEIHGEKIYHLDIKPANIMMDRAGHCTLIDFGASKNMSQQERATTGLSLTGMPYTPGYAPHEQVGQVTSSIGPWTDLYALGATIYNLLTGLQPPMIDIDDTAEGSRMFNYPKEVSMVMRRAVSAMMNPSRMRRPQSVADVHSLLAGTSDTIYKKPKPSPKTDTDTTYGGGTVVIGGNGGAIKRKRKKNSWWLIPLVCLLVVGFVAGVWWLLKPGKIVINEGEPPRGGIDITKDQTIEAAGVTFNMKAVKGGKFYMGATAEQEGDAADNERPVHAVTLDDYMIGETEVTQALWEAVMGYNPSHFHGGDLPVENVSWDECQEFIKRLNGCGLQFRLPTEAEWEYAARGGCEGMGYKYAGSNVPDECAWYWTNSGNQPLYGEWSMERVEANGGRTHEVAQKQPNELGIYDMNGNVYEWCQDYYSADYYLSSPEKNPYNQRYDVKAVIRGGCWGDSDRYCRVSGRGGRKASAKDYRIGLRLAL